MIQQTVQLGSVPAAAGGFLLQQAGASGGTERGTLLRQVLPVAGDAAVAQHGAGGLLRRLGGETLTTSFGSMRKGLAGVQLPKSYQAMCCQCGSIVRHRLDRAEALLCPKGHALPPTIAMAAIQLKENPAQPKRGMRPEAQLIRALVAMNRSMGEG